MTTSDPSSRFRVGVDIGGTFTDLVAYEPESGALITTKGLSGADDIAASFSALLDSAGVSHADVDLLIHGTTVVTNLIIEKAGAKVGLVTTRGFRDVLEIGWSFRDDAYDLQWTKQLPLVPRPLRLEVTERIGPTGKIETKLDAEDVRRAAHELVRLGAEVIAVFFLHAYANPVHERRAQKLIAAELPGVPCILSSDVDPRLGEYERVSTTVLSAYATPKLAEYVDAIETWAGKGRTAYFMQSEGGVIPSSTARSSPASLVLSGPAAGVLAACHVSELAKLPNLISMDVGGTSADVCVIRDGRPGLREILEVAPSVPLRSPCIDVVSVGAGGGSIAWTDQGMALRVGPQSAGARPGPACYGAGGTLPTVTDANVVLGITDAERLLGGRLRGKPALAATAIGKLGGRLGMSTEDAALGIYRIANANMAQAIRTLTVQRGIDPRDFTLVSFGGAGGQHAIEVAREMQVPTVIFPPHPSTFSALGLLTADVQMTRTAPVVGLLSEVDPSLPARRFSELEDRVLKVLDRVSAGGARPQFTRFANLRYRGQVHSIRTPVQRWEESALVEVFENSHFVRYGTRLGDPVEVVNVGVTGRLALERPRLASEARGGGKLEILRKSRVLMEGGEIPVVGRASIGAGVRVPSPCLVEEEDSVLYLPSGVPAVADRYGNLVCQVGAQARRRR